MNKPNHSIALFSSIENYINLLVLRFFPAWYTTQVARNIELSPLGKLNPVSYLSRNWLSINATIQGLSQSLPAEPQWQPLNNILSKLISEHEYTRRFTMMSINGIENHSDDKDWPTLIAYAQENAQDIAIHSAEEFEALTEQAFPEKNKPHHLTYREWDGRCYWSNPEAPDKLAALQLYGHEHTRDAQVHAKIKVESINSKALDSLRNHWWLLLLNREDALRIMALVDQTKLPIVLADFEWRRNDLAFLVARKDNRRVNQIFLNLLHNRSTKEVLEFGSYLSRNYHPFHNQEKRG